MRLTVLLAFALARSLGLSLAYIPAQATNITSVAEDTGQYSSITVQWYPNGSFSEAIAYQLVGKDSTGTSKGALVHFSEQQLPIGSTVTPWIALISCDANSTNASSERDIFSLAQERGAVAAVLYSTTSVSCFINPEYSDPEVFTPRIDVYATQSRASSLLLDDQFTNAHVPEPSSLFDPVALNASAGPISAAVVNHTVPVPGLLFATLTAFNTTNAAPPNSSGPDAPPGGIAPGSQTNFSGSQGISPTTIGVIIVAGLIGCLGVVGLYKWYHKRRARASRTGASAHSAPVGDNVASTRGEDPAGDTRGTMEVLSGPVSAPSILRSNSQVARYDISPETATFHSDRLVRTPQEEPAAESEGDVVEVRR